VSIQILLTGQALKQQIETKAVDVAFRTLDPTDLSDLQSRATSLGLKVDVGASPQIRFLVFNVHLVPDVNVRKAIAYLVDRPLINTQVFKGTVEPLYSMIPPSMPYADPVFQGRYGDANIAEANALLTQLGFAVVFNHEAIARDIR
jgi:peptide/nickel transport system substrate-binding protein